MTIPRCALITTYFLVFAVGVWAGAASEATKKPLVISRLVKADQGLQVDCTETRRICTGRKRSEAIKSF